MSRRMDSDDARLAEHFGPDPPRVGAEREHRYAENWYRHLKRLPPKSYMAHCFWCGMRGILGYELIYRGVMYKRNLMCDKCHADPLTMELWEACNWVSPNYLKGKHADQGRERSTGQGDDAERQQGPRKRRRPTRK